MAPRNTHQGRAPTMPQWQSGDIAYLKSADYFYENEYNALIESGYMPYKATNHPVIILKRCSNTSTHVLITPVSAYSSGDFNDNLAPWKQEAHRRKSPHNFRSFAGSERANDRSPLYLEEGKKLPKPKTSWVNIQSVWVAPLSVLGVFTKSTEGHLRVRKDSLEDLTKHMKFKCRKWEQCTNNPLLRREAESKPSTAHKQQQQATRDCIPRPPHASPPAAPAKPAPRMPTTNVKAVNPRTVNRFAKLSLPSIAAVA